ncbi:MAG: Fur family transcriptional regulator [candidate division WOR-3 bacterium]|nr:Fur family transcriptional regulator [candidate division WOR-3 bacterium]
MNTNRPNRKPRRLRRMMRNRGYRMTSAREAILDVLSKETKHLSAKEVYSKVLLIEPGTGLTTVYRTLETLSEMGIVNKIEIGDKTSRYELIREGHRHHHHIICTNCSKVIDYDDFMEEEQEMFCKLEKELEKKYNVDIKGHNVQFFAICKECRK